jgi:uncharacterized protein (TIGR02646 family)
MRKLVRPAAPNCLSKYKAGRDQWSMQAPTPEHRQQIWNSLNAMQGEYCAYCESKLQVQKKQIEHFRSRNDFEKLTFTWDNLFGACNEPNRCGNYKENRKKNPAYDPDNVVKPDEEALTSYIRLLDNGMIECTMSIDANDRRRVETTLKVFNLNGDTALVNCRRGYIDAAKGWVHSLNECYKDNPEAVISELRSLIAQNPYQMIISNFLGIPPI